jgi:hypothetical protein
VVAFSGARTPRLSCQRINDIAARRNGRCRGARPIGPLYVRASSPKRAAGLSRTISTCASAHAAATPARAGSIKLSVGQGNGCVMRELSPGNESGFPLSGSAWYLRRLISSSTCSVRRRLVSNDRIEPATDVHRAALRSR